jgi:hypothetical protein
MATQIFSWFILSYGLMNIVVFSKIFYGVRNFFQKHSGNYDPLMITPRTTSGILQPLCKFISGIITCPMCFGFHGGWFLSLTVFSPAVHLFGLPLYVSWFFDGILSSGAVWAINSIIEWFELNRPSNNHN